MFTRSSTDAAKPSCVPISPASFLPAVPDGVTLGGGGQSEATARDP
jgi:hypothetical protein